MTAKSIEETKKPAKSKEQPKHPLMLDGRSWDRQRVVDIVCAKIASSSKGIARILQDGYNGHTLPDYVTFKAWLRDDSELSTQYAQSKEDQGDYLADDLMDVADEPPLRDAETGKVDSGWVNLQRLRVDTRKWTASKLKPKKYGDKIDVNQTVTHADLTDEELDRRLAEQVLKRKNAG